jgi:integrase
MSANSINKTLTRLAQVLEVAVEYEFLEKNPARGAQRRLKPSKPKRAAMSATQVAALLEGTDNRVHRAILLTAILAGGLRASELTGLRRRDLNLAHSTLTVHGSKTDAAERVVELDPGLRDELAEYVAATGLGPANYLFPGQGGNRRDRNALRTRVLEPAIERANRLLERRGLPPISPNVTFHSLRRTYASLAAEAGVDPAWTAAQIGHTRAAFTLDVYTDVEHRRHSAAEQIGGLIRSNEGARPDESDEPDPTSDGAAGEISIERPDRRRART